MRYKVAFLGTPKFAALILEKLIGTNFEPKLIITGQDQKSDRSLALKANSVKLAAQKHNIAISYKLADLDGSFDLAILVAYGKIIPDNILSLPKYGFVNVHPSLLPKYRGPSPITSAILNGDKYTGVTLIVLDSELDHGPQIAQQEVEIADDDTHTTLSQKLANLGSKLLIRTLPEYLAENITPEPQNHNVGTYTEKITKDSGKIDFNNPPDKLTLNCMIRAYFPWPSVWFELDGKRFKLLPGTITDSPTHRLTNSPLLIQPEGKNGYPQLNDKLKPVIENKAQS